MLAVGIVLTLASSLVVLPAMYAAHERIGMRLRRGKEVRRKPVGLDMPFLEKFGTALARPAVSFAVIATMLGATVALGVAGSRAQFEANMLEIEPPDMPSVLLHREILDRFEINPDFAMLTTDNVEDARKIRERLKSNRLIGRVETIATYLPTEKEQALRAKVVERIRQNAATWLEPAVTTGLPGGAIASPPAWSVQAEIPADQQQALLDELTRLQLNVQEIGQMAYMGMQRRLKAHCDGLTGGENEKMSLILSLRDRLAGDPRPGRKVALYQQEYIPVLA